tara:strand:+ start:10323 stop:11162 length:840 start_codon:yes stop_codon:yes gene_type:complete
MNIISGEQFQLLSEISFYTKFNSIIEDQNNCIKQNIHKISDVSVNDIKKYQKIFIYTHDVHNFMDKFLDHLNKDTVIITHNSDNGIYEEHKKYLDNKKISKWFCQNRELSHPKLFSIPIGIANSQWPHGKESAIRNIIENNTKKDNLVYKNFQVGTNYGERASCDNITCANGILMSPNTSQQEYWNNIKRSLFVISPPGNGIDCHRIWECLYLKAIPVLKLTGKQKHAFSQFTHLPILFVDDWNEITIDFLRSKISDYKNFNFNDISEIDINFWKDKIN